jgi:hypothetical protein
MGSLGRTGDVGDERAGPDRVIGLQRGHGRGALVSKPSIRVAWSHSPHHGGRRCQRSGRAGSSAGESLRARTA